MRPFRTALFLFAATIGSAVAQPKAQVDRWFADLAKAQSAEDAKPLEDKIEAAFRQSGSPSLDLLIGRAKQAVGGGDSKTAAALVVSINKLAPDFAEGWRLRATLDAAAGNDASAMLALQKVMPLNPRHFPAMADLAGMLEDFGDKKAALDLYRKVLVLDPKHEGAVDRVRALGRDVEGQGI
jgi:predicted TPR repeat methyltransferase